MTFRRRAQPEKRTQNAILAWLKFNGFLAFHITNMGFYRSGRYNIVGQWHIPGIPDIEVILPQGRTIRIEVKAPKGVVSAAQAAFMAKLAGLGHPCMVARSVEDVMIFFSKQGYGS